MKPSKELSDIRETQKYLICLSERSEYLRSTLYGRAIRYDRDKVQTSPADMMSERLSEVCDHDARIRKRQKKLDRRKDIMRAYLDRLDNPDHARVLDLYYLSLSTNGRVYSVADVARLIHRKPNYTYVIMERAMKKIDEIL